MSELKGVLRRVDLGPGAWVLEAEDGARYSLDGTVPAHLEGQPVRVQGQVEDAMGFAMTGPVLVVRRIRPA